MINLFSDLFSEMLRMSYLASLIIIGIIVIRQFLKGFPKTFSYVLWGAAWLRLILPVELPFKLSFFSLFKWYPHQEQITTGVENTISSVQAINMPVPLSNKVFIDQISQLNSFQPTSPINSVDPIQVFLMMGSLVWCIGAVVLLFIALITYLKTANRLETAVKINYNVYESPAVESPFILGLIQPKIYVPSHLSESALNHILAHEKIHLARKDYLIKPFTYFIVLLHWFNPLVWVAFYLMSKDMEMSCDEQVINHLSKEERIDYSNTLLSFAMPKPFTLVNPLAFGESNVKTRILNVLKYKKPKTCIMMLGILLTVVLLMVFSTTPMGSNELAQPITISNVGYDVERLIANGTPYVGNASKVMAIVDSVPYPEGTKHGTIALHTSNEPYGLTVVINLSEKQLEFYDDPNNQLQINAGIFFAMIDNLNYVDFKFITNEEMKFAQGLNKVPKSFEMIHFNRSDLSVQVSDALNKYEKNNGAIYQLIDSLKSTTNTTTEPIQTIPDFTYKGNDLAERVVYDTYIKKMNHDLKSAGAPKEGFFVVAPTIHKVVEVKNQYKVFATVYGSRVIEKNGMIEEVGGEIIPLAMTYIKKGEGYDILQIDFAKDGAYFNPSIIAFCVEPVTDNPIKGLYDQILSDYSSNDARRALLEKNLKQHLSTLLKK